MSPLEVRSQFPVSPSYPNKPRKQDETFLQHSHILRLLKTEDIEQRKVCGEVQLIVSVHLSQIKREMRRTEYKLKIKFGRKRSALNFAFVSWLRFPKFPGGGLESAAKCQVHWILQLKYGWIPLVSAVQYR